MQKIIELKNVAVYRGATRVFDGLSLDIIQGRNTVILGPNGAGKTTLLKLLARDIYPVKRDDSSIRIFGREQWNVWDLRARLGIVSHDLQREYAGFARGMNVVLSGYYSSVDTWSYQRFSPAQRDRAAQVMETLGVSHLEDKMYAEMSTGEQRRLLLGRALVNDPDTLILDEPTGGLDVHACFQYIDTVRALMRAGKTLILVTHHIHEIPPEISHAVLMTNGSVMLEGEKSQVLSSANLSRLFGVALELIQANGFYQVLPRA